MLNNLTMDPSSIGVLALWALMNDKYLLANFDVSESTFLGHANSGCGTGMYVLSLWKSNEIQVSK